MAGSWSVSSAKDLWHVTLGHVGSIKTEGAVYCSPSSSANPCPIVWWLRCTMVIVKLYQ